MRGDRWERILNSKAIPFHFRAFSIFIPRTAVRRCGKCAVGIHHLAAAAGRTQFCAAAALLGWRIFGRADERTTTHISRHILVKHFRGFARLCACSAAACWCVLVWLLLCAGGGCFAFLAWKRESLWNSEIVLISISLVSAALPSPTTSMFYFSS